MLPLITPFHYFASSNDHKKPLPHIITAITLGLISSIIGYLALYTAPFPGLKQIALFCCIGLLCAYLTVVLLFDSFSKTIKTPACILIICNSVLALGKKIAQSKNCIFFVAYSYHFLGHHFAT